jgi:hypothetical protein
VLAKVNNEKTNAFFSWPEEQFKARVIFFFVMTSFAVLEFRFLRIKCSSEASVYSSKGLFAEL